MRHGGDIYRVMEEYSLKREEIIDFSANINPLGPPEGVLEMLRGSLEELVHYPEPRGRSLCKKLALGHGIKEDQVILGNGAVHLIYPLFQMLKRDYQRAIIVEPTFFEYRLALQSSGIQIQSHILKEERDFSLHLPSLMRLWKRKDLIILCNPNNPTGGVIPREILQEILSHLEKRESLLFMDEAFMDFLSPDESLIQSRESFHRLFILRSLTKFYSLPGLRMGYGIGDTKIIQRLKERIPPWSMNHLAQKAALWSLDDSNFQAKTCSFIREEREYMVESLKELPVKVFPSKSNFLLVKLESTQVESSELIRALLARGIMIRDSSSFVGLKEGFFRLAIRSREENKALLAGLKDIFSR